MNQFQFITSFCSELPPSIEEPKEEKIVEELDVPAFMKEGRHKKKNSTVVYLSKEEPERDENGYFEPLENFIIATKKIFRPLTSFFLPEDEE